MQKRKKHCDWYEKCDAAKAQNLGNTINAVAVFDSVFGLKAVRTSKFRLAFVFLKIDWRDAQVSAESPMVLRNSNVRVSSGTTKTILLAREHRF